MIQLGFKPEFGRPLHLQLAQTLKNAIRADQIKAGEQMPTEAELCQAYGLSRPVIRQAYKHLSEEGLIVRQQGKGTFVRQNELNYALMASMLPLSEKIRLSGRTPGVIERSREVLTYDPLTMAKLELESGDQVLAIERTYYGDGMPLFHTQILLPLKLYPKLEKQEAENASLWEQLKKHYRIQPVKAKRILKAVALPIPICQHLDLPENSPGFRIDTLIYEQHGFPMELSVAYLKGDGTTVSMEPFR